MARPGHARAVPFSETEWQDACAQLEAAADPVDRAVRFFVNCRQSLAGRMDAFADLSTPYPAWNERAVFSLVERRRGAVRRPSVVVLEV
jgi:hypothetical protein